jgi:hypothetical protein
MLLDGIADRLVPNALPDVGFVGKRAAGVRRFTPTSRGKKYPSRAEREESGSACAHEPYW